MKFSLEHEDVCTAVREFMQSRGMNPPEDDDKFKFTYEPSSVPQSSHRIVVEVSSVHLDRKRPEAPAAPAARRPLLAVPKDDPIARAAAEAVEADGGGGGDDFPSETDDGAGETGEEPAPLDGAEDQYSELIAPKAGSDLSTERSLQQMLGMMTPEDRKKAAAIAQRVRGGEKLTALPKRSTVFDSLDDAGIKDGDIGSEI